MIKYISQLIAAIDHFTSRLGKTTAYLTLAMMFTTCIVVVLRYGFGIGSIGLQESITYMHAAVFLLCAGFTLQNNGHVRVDIFYQRFSPPKRAWIDALGSLILLIPVCIFLIWVSWQFVSRAWSITEISSEPGGLPAVFLLKTLIPLGAITLGLQGLAELLRNLLVLMLNTTDSTEAHQHD